MDLVVFGRVSFTYDPARRLHAAAVHTLFANTFSVCGKACDLCSLSTLYILGFSILPRWNSEGTDGDRTGTSAVGEREAYTEAHAQIKP